MIRVIVTGYNCKDYVKPCIDSIKAQSVDFRAIIVDDASTDGTTQEIVNNLDHRFELIVKQTNEGPAAARYKALSTLVAHPDDLIVLVDLDDTILPNALQIAQEAQADVTMGSTVTESGKVLSGIYPEKVIQEKSFRSYAWRCYPLRTFRYRVYESVGFKANDFKYKEDVIIKGKTYAKKGDWYKVCTDVALMFPILENAHSIKHISTILYNYNDITPHTGRSKYPIELWAETSKQINDKK